MSDRFIRTALDSVFKIDNIINLLYMEFTNSFFTEGESHNFWELVYIDKGELLCTAQDKRFLLKGGELIFHKPNEYHKIESEQGVAPNVSILAFELCSSHMNYFENKIIRLNSEEKNLLAQILYEGATCLQSLSDKPPVLGMKKITAPFGAEQMTKNLLEMFLIKLYRSENVTEKATRRSVRWNGTNLPASLRQILLYLEENVDTKLTINQIAAHFCQSASTLKKQFLAYDLGGIIEYFNRQKIKRIKRLIQENAYTFTEIAEKICFDNVQYFSSFFKHHTGMTPTQYNNSILSLPSSSSNPNVVI